jgi:Amt family ammonium transporter
LLACVLALLAHAGFALYETGLCRAKNASTSMTMNASVWCLCAVGFFISGFALVSGGKRFFLSGVAASDSATLLLFFLMLTRVTVTASIPTGALSERLSFKSFFLFSLVIGALIAPTFDGWIWNPLGWIAKRGGLDYAGSSVIHLQGGAIGLVTAWILGPRIGKYDMHGRPRPILGHHVPMAILGCLIIAVALLALNVAPSLVWQDGRALLVAANSLLAATAGAAAACAWMVIAYGKPDPTVMCNGLIGGLAAIAAPCAFIEPWAALLIGAIAGVLVVCSVPFWERRGIDDPVGVVSVHGVAGLWGVLSLGLFADGTFNHVAGLFYGNAHQLVAQCIVVAACILWSLIAAGVGFALIDRFFGPARVPREVELMGLDIPELGVPAYRELLSSVPTGTAAVHEPRPATSPVPLSGQRFSIIIEGVDSNTLIGAWSGLCQQGSSPPSGDFKEVYPFLTTVTGNRFRFSGGDPSRIKESLTRLFEHVLPDKAVSAKLES